MIGYRHSEVCLCGCHMVAGLAGAVVQDSDTPKLATLGLMYVAFEVPGAGGGPSSEVVVCYDRPAAEERHEAVRLFEPAPAQIPGQLGF